jgi:small ligand-binding sensory domain FIST
LFSSGESVMMPAGACVARCAVSGGFASWCLDARRQRSQRPSPKRFGFIIIHGRHFCMMSTPSSNNRFASALSTASDLERAVEQVAGELTAALGGNVTHAIAFLSHDYATDWETLPQVLGERLGRPELMGCSAEGVIGTRREQEEGPGLTVWAANLPDADIVPFRLEFTRTAEGGAIVGWPDELVADWPHDATLLLLADPFTFPADYLVERLNEEHPGTRVVGGMASGATTPGGNRLFMASDVHPAGAVAWMIRRGVTVQSVVSQGCRPIGEKFVVTAADGNLILQLGGKPALEQLQQVFHRLPTHEQALVQRGLHIGRVVSEYLDEPHMGDFLIRNVLGIDHETGAVAVGDFLRPGQTVQFHLREESAASAEFQQMLRRDPEAASAQSALLFTCNGRGSRLFSTPHHDATMLANELGDLPVAGLFAQGEIGPVGGRNFLHGFTASVALFR